MKLYLDNCMFNRPFDDQSSLVIRLESEAKLAIQESIRSGEHELIWSYILDYENEQNPFWERKEQIGHWRKYAKHDITETPSLIEQARQLHQLGLKAMDALHIACAVTAEADCFLTTDKGILKKAAIVQTLAIKHPIDFVREIFP